MSKRDDTHVEHLARELETKLNNTGFYEYYCKVGYKLSEAEIMAHLAQALKGKQPSRLFAYLCNKSMKAKING